VTNPEKQRRPTGFRQTQPVDRSQVPRREDVMVNINPLQGHN
jgi:hypothetical protein